MQIKMKSSFSSGMHCMKVLDHITFSKLTTLKTVLWSCFRKKCLIIDTIHWIDCTSLPHCLVFPFLSKLNIVITFKKLCTMCKRAITFSATCLCLILSLVSTVLKIWKQNFILQVSNHSTCSFLFVCFFLFLSHSHAKRLHMHYPFKWMEWQCQSPDRKNKWNK